MWINLKQRGSSEGWLGTEDSIVSVYDLEILSLFADLTFPTHVFILESGKKIAGKTESSSKTFP